MLTFYTNPQSRGRIARWMLEEIGQPYETVVLDYYTSMKAPEYLAVNPMGKVPALVHDGKVVTENAAICTYLAMAFPKAGLMAEDKAAYFRWMFFAAGPLEQAVVNTSFGWLTKDQHEKRRAGYGDLADVLGALTGHLARNDFIADGRFTAADVFIGSQVSWGMQFGTIPASEVLSAYWARLKDRPALTAANAKDNALIAETKP
jgi:glutathione S-transferase